MSRTARRLLPFRPVVAALLFYLLYPATLMASPSIDAMLVMPLQERQDMADTFFEEKKYRRARKQYMILARLGSKHAQHRLAIMHLEGLGTRKDHVEGWVWASLAAEFHKEPYATLRNESWTLLSEAEQEQAVEELEERMLRFSDSAVAFQIMTKARRKLRMETIGYGLLSEGLVRTYRAEGMAGDPQSPDAWNTILKNLYFHSKMYWEGERVTLGEFEVLDDEPEATSGEAPEEDQEEDLRPPFKQPD